MEFIPKTKISSTMMLITFSLCFVPPAFAENFIVKFDHIDVYDDGDNEPDGAGEITFYVSLNGTNIYKKYKKVSDKGNKVVLLNFSKRTSISGNNTINIRVRGNEYDKWSGNENCWGNVSHHKNDIGAKTLRCGRGDMGYYLHYRIDRAN